MLQCHCLLICLLLPVLDVFRGLMHRDIKPDNLLVSHILDDITQLTTDAVKVADFGISVLVPHGQVRLVNISSSPLWKSSMSLSMLLVPATALLIVTHSVLCLQPMLTADCERPLCGRV